MHGRYVEPYVRFGSKAEIRGVRQAAIRDRQSPAYTHPRPSKDLPRDCQS